MSDTPWRVLNLVQILVIFPGVWAVMWLLPRARNRLLGARCDVVIPRPHTAGSNKAAAAAIVATMTAAVMVIMRSGRHMVALTVLLTGFLTAILLMRIGQSSGAGRYIGLGAAIAAASLFIALRAADFNTSFRWQFGSIGALLTASGLVTLARFLHTHPREPEARA